MGQKKSSLALSYFSLQLNSTQLNSEKKGRMYPSVDGQPKHAGGSHNYENPSHPIHGYPQPAAAVGVPAYDAYNNTNNYPQMPQIPQQQQRLGHPSAYNNTNNYPQMPQIPQQQQQRLGHPSAWTAGLCGCGDDCSSCCLTCWCPCITFGQIAEIVDSGSTSCCVSGTLYALLLHFTGCACCYSCFYRKRLRSKFNLEEKPCGDCLVHFCCESCALCQEYRELKSRGFDPSLGWAGNLEKQNQSVSQARISTAPPLSQAMDK